jgi:hypothetical protein
MATLDRLHFGYNFEFSLTWLSNLCNHLCQYMSFVMPSLLLENWPQASRPCDPVSPHDAKRIKNTYFVTRSF